MSFSRLLTLLGFGIVFGGGAMVLGGCPGSLDDPNQFTGLGGGTPTGGSCDVEGDFVASCDGSSCHGPDFMAGGFDLVSPGVAARVAGTATQGTSCMGLLADPSNPTASAIYVVLTDMSCTPFGTMPQNGEPFSQAQIDCVEQWIAGLSGGNPTGGGMMGTGGMGTGGMGTGGMGGN